jgi:hypothetical protein
MKLSTAALLLACLRCVSVVANDGSDARFEGPKRANPIRIENETCTPARAAGAGTISFDLAWDNSWRAAWAVPAGEHGGKGTLQVENWDAAWVFVKFRQPGDNHWSHATLSTTSADHSVPAGATLDIGLSDDPADGGTGAKRGLGAFVYRKTPGSGPNNWDGLTLHWLAGADGVERVDADVEIKVCAIEMVYVPQGAFWAGDGGKGNAGQFTAGDSKKPFRIGSESAITLGGAASGNLGNSDQVGMGSGEDFNSSIQRKLPARFPKGFAAFYCMKYEISWGDYAPFCDTISAGQRKLIEPAAVKGDPGAPCNNMRGSDVLAYAGWAGLRPMSELEYEKACRGPLEPVPGGTASAEAGASYWGIRNLTDDLPECTVVVGTHAGRLFAGTHGTGTAAVPVGPKEDGDLHRGTFGYRRMVQPAGWYFHETGLGFGVRRGTASSRAQAGSFTVARAATISRQKAGLGFRCVRTATAGRPPVSSDQLAQEAAAYDEKPWDMFNEKLRLENVTLLRQGSGGQARDARTAIVRFDIAWDESWRSDVNHDAAWVFFKARKGTPSTPLRAGWQHVRLAADRELNPTGYGQKGGTPLEFVVPGGKDGFTGVFVQRAAAGTGPLVAKGVTVIMDLSSLSLTQLPEVQAFGIEMVYVAEGPFYLGSGGTEPNRFYQYTDGSQNRLPYKVTDAGAVPTGPQLRRLWATGVYPDATDAGEIPASFPNGYAAFYCMKFSVKQGQFAGFLGMQEEFQSIYHDYSRGNWTVLRRTHYEGTSLSWLQGASFGAWAGLRPMTELEYEKACRGPRAPVPNEAPASYWGIRNLNVGTTIGRTVSAGDPVGRRFAGTHGSGTAARPGDWPPSDATGVMDRGGGLGVEVPRIYTSTRQEARVDNDGTGAQRLPNRYFSGWRGVRTALKQSGTFASGQAPKREIATARKPAAGFKLDLNPLPDLRAADIGIFYLSGSCHNGGSKALKVELSSLLPDVCFPEGVASRTFTAAPKAATPFKILTALTRRTLRSARKGQALKLSIQVPGGEVLAEKSVRVPLVDPEKCPLSVISTLDGGAATLRIANATDQARKLAIMVVPPKSITMPEADRKQLVQVAAGATAEASFPIRRQLFGDYGFYRLPYRVAAWKGKLQDGVAFVELRVKSRWWVGQHKIQKGPKDVSDTPLSGPGDDLGLGGLGDLLAESGLGDSAAEKKEKKRESEWDYPKDLFKASKPPARWQKVTHGASLWLGKLKRRPPKDTVVSAATRVLSPADREVVIKMGSGTLKEVWLDDQLLESPDPNVPQKTTPFVGRVIVNGKVVYDSRPEVTQVRKPVQLRKGANTMLVQSLTTDTPVNLFALFHHAKDGSRVDDLTFDVEKR